MWNSISLLRLSRRFLKNAWYITFSYNPRLNTRDQSAPSEHPLCTLRPGDQNKSMIAVYFPSLHSLTEGDDGFHNSCFDCSQYWEMAPAVTDKHIPAPGFHSKLETWHRPSFSRSFCCSRIQAKPTDKPDLSDLGLPLFSINQIICLNCTSAAN